MGKSSDLISRFLAIDRMNQIRPAETVSDYQKGIDVGLAMARIALKDQPSAQPELLSGDWKHKSAQALDLFTKCFCRDKEERNDLVFRCNQCEFEMSDDTCLVKKMARALCPDYRDFGSMGDL